MGVDQYTSAHIFEALPDGGRIVLQRETDDPEGTASYVADTLPRGGQVRVTSSDPEAIAAIHAFLAFQRHDHRASGH